MNSDLTEIYEKAFEFFQKKEYSIALSIIQASESKLQESGMLLMMAADCFYELGRDIEALKTYAEYLKNHPTGKASNFALFNSAICLKNLYLEEEAKKILLLVNESHPGLNNEMKDSNERLAKIAIAREYIRKLPPFEIDKPLKK